VHRQELKNAMEAMDFAKANIQKVMDELDSGKLCQEASTNVFDTERKMKQLQGVVM
jgi:hypothetical protein